MTHESHVDRVHSEDLVLDIGGDVGALAITAPASFREREIEVSPLADPARRTHTVIHERRDAGGATRYVGVFPDLRQGEYRIWADPWLPGTVTVHGGEVAAVDLVEADAPGVGPPAPPDAARSTPGA